MRLVIAAVGKLKAGPERQLYASYAKRIDALARASHVGPVELIAIPESRSADARARKREEGEKLSARLGSGVERVALDAAGEVVTSEQLAAYLRFERDAGRSALAFLIGGPDGHATETLQGRQKTLSFGRITLPHGLCRIVLAEQLYRAVTIIANHPYHRA